MSDREQPKALPLRDEGPQTDRTLRGWTAFEMCGRWGLIVVWAADPFTPVVSVLLIAMVAVAPAVLAAYGASNRCTGTEVVGSSRKTAITEFV
jgi:hypothetical protein